MGPADEKLNESTMGITQNSFAEQTASFAMCPEKKIETQPKIEMEFPSTFSAFMGTQKSAQI